MRRLKAGGGCLLLLAVAMMWIVSMDASANARVGCVTFQVRGGAHHVHLGRQTMMYARDAR